MAQLLAVLIAASWVLVSNPESSSDDQLLPEKHVVPQFQTRLKANLNATDFVGSQLRSANLGMLEASAGCTTNPTIPPQCSPTPAEEVVPFKSCIKVSMAPVGKCSCAGIEQAGHGPGTRKFSVSCKHSTTTLTCHYRGNPHHCQKYNNNGQQVFYQQLRDTIGTSMCKIPFGYCPESPKGYHTQLCKDCDKSNFFFEGRN